MHGWFHPALWIVIGACLATNLVYLAIDRRPFNWDDAWYAENAIRLHDAWAREGVVSALAYFTSALTSKAPLIIALPQPLLWLLGRTDVVFGLTCTISLVVVSIYLALLARQFMSAGAAAVSVLVLSLMPLTSGMARQFMVEMPLSALVLMFIYHLLRSEDFTRTRHALLCGLAAGLGMLAKVTFPLFAIGIVLIAYLRFAVAADPRVGRFVRRPSALASSLALTAMVLLGPASAFVADRLGFVSLGLLIGLGLTLGVVLAQRGCGTGVSPVKSHGRDAGATPRRFNFAAALAIAVWLPFPWYLKNAETIFAFAYSASVGAASLNYGANDLFSPRAILDYWIANVNFGFGVVFVAGLGVLPVCLLFGRLARCGPAQAGDTRWRSLVALVISWVLPALVIFTLGRNRSTRFLMPLLPAVAMLYGGLFHLSAQRLRALTYVVLSVHTALGAVTYLISSFGGPACTFGAVAADPRVGRWILWSSMMSGRGAAQAKYYPLPAVLDAALRSARTPVGRPVNIVCLTDKPHVNLNSLALTAAKAGINAAVSATAYQGSLEQAMGSLPSADVLVYQEGGENGPEFSNRWGPQIRDLIDVAADPRVGRQRDHQKKLRGWRLEPDSSVSLPDGGVVRFYARVEGEEPND